MSVLTLSPELQKDQVFQLVEDFLSEAGFSIAAKDNKRPWGGFFVIEESQIRHFQQKFFSELSLSDEQFAQKLSPKFLLVAPGSRLSWQYHFRRAEVWNLVAGESALSRSHDDREGPVEKMQPGKMVSLAKGERHRLIGMDTWGVVAEIWMHSDPSHPSDESDIVRLQDDYSRK